METSLPHIEIIQERKQLRSSATQSDAPKHSSGATQTQQVERTAAGTSMDVKKAKMEGTQTDEVVKTAIPVADAAAACTQTDAEISPTKNVAQTQTEGIKLK